MSKKNERDHRLLRDAVATMHRMGLKRSAEISGLEAGQLATYLRGYRPDYLKSKTRSGLRQLLGFAPPETANPDRNDGGHELMRRAVDALELMAVSLVVLAESVDPMGSADDDDDDQADYAEVQI